MKRAGLSLAETLVGMLLTTLILLTLSSAMAVEVRANNRNANAAQNVNDMSVVRQTLQNAFNNATDSTEFNTQLPGIDTTTKDITFTAQNPTSPGTTEQCRIFYNAGQKSIMIQYGNRLTQQLGQGKVTDWHIDCKGQNNLANNTGMKIRQTIKWTSPPTGTVQYQEDLFITGTRKVTIN